MRPIERVVPWLRRTAWRVRGRGRWRLALLSVGAPLLAAWLAVRGAETLVDWWWYDSLGRGQVYATGLAARWLLGLLGGAIAAVALFGNLALAQRLVEREQRRDVAGVDEMWAFLARVSARLDAKGGRAGRRVLRWLRILAAVGTALLALRASDGWEIALPAALAVPFGYSEPYFGRDAAFYVFTLPALRWVHGWLLSLALGGLALSLVATLAVSADHLRLGFGSPRQALQVLRSLGRQPRLHLAGIAATTLLLLAAGHQIAAAEVVFSTRAQVAGVAFPGFADVWGRLPVAWLLSALAGALAGAVLAAAARRRWRPAGWIGGVYLGVAALGWLATPVLQAVVVSPNELDLERPYLARFMEMTRRAYGLDNVREAPLPPTTEPVLPDADELANLPLWSQVSVRGNLNQLQAFRPYYVFSDADPARYEVNGRQRLVLLSVRELDSPALPGRSWLSRHVQFTHGYGAVAVLAGAMGAEGEPEWVLSDLPPRGTPHLERPEVFFGEHTWPYAVVGASEPGPGDPTVPGLGVSRQPAVGVPVGGPARRAVLSVAFADLSLLFSQAVLPDSRLLYRRQVLERVERLAPFLRVDPDAYPVLADGRLVWVVEGYTTSSEMPIALPTPFGEGSRVRYVRLSVRATVDAFDGSTRLYLADPGDPMAATWARVYPGLLEPLDAMPASVRTHLRYPRALLALQASVVARFHTPQPEALYHGEDVWRPVEEKFEARQDNGPYYLLQRLPGETREELLLVQPFSPFDPAGDRHNLTALLIGRSDPPHVGSLLLQRFPRDRVAPGPVQVERRIDQDADIAAQMGTWQRSGSLVMRGRLVTLPFASQPLFAEAVFLQRGVRPMMPRMQRVILSNGSRVVMEESVEAALARLATTSRGTAP